MSSISVLMSVYDSDKPRYLNAALQSVWMDQTKKPNEIILVEDGPLKNDLHEIICKWRHIIGSKLIILVNEENLGLTKSLNKGLAVAVGTYIARMDSDDISLPDRFEKQLQYMEAHPEVSVLGGGMLEIDEVDSVVLTRIYPETNEKIRKHIAFASPIAHPSAFIRKEIFIGNLKYDERYRKNQDLKLWFDLLSRNVVIHNLPYPIIKYRRTKNTYLRRSNRSTLNSELEIYLHGITLLYGRFNWRLLIPVLRYCVKSMPLAINQYIYKYMFDKSNDSL